MLTHWKPQTHIGTWQSKCELNSVVGELVLLHQLERPVLGVWMQEGL